MNTPQSFPGALPGRLAAPLLLALALGGCASGSPQWDRQFGDSARQLKAQQLRDPAAPHRHAGAEPMADGRTVREAGDRYVDTLRAPPPNNVIQIGVGQGGGGR